MVDSRDYLFTKLSGQTFIRRITRAGVPWMVARLVLHWYSSEFRCFVNPIVQGEVVENGIAGIQSHPVYDELRAAST